jgi:colanic acid/amylovoran biosynthesis protein
MEILISNIYSWKNKGDAAIVIAMLEDIRNQFPDAKISLSSYDHEDIGKYGDYGFYCNILSLFKNTYKAETSGIFQKIFYVVRRLDFKFKIVIFGYLSKLKIYPYWLFPNIISEKVKSYRTFDLVVACGGGYLMTVNKSSLIERLFRCNDLVLFCYDFYLAKLFDKPYILYNQSIGPFGNGQDFRALKHFILGASVIICREEITFRRLTELGFNNLVQGADIAFNLMSKECDILNGYNFSKDNINIGITVRNWLNPREQSNYENEICRFISSEVSENKKVHFYFMPQVIFERVGDNDLIVSKKIKDKLKGEYRDNVKIVTEDLHPSELKYIIGNMDYFIGTRMHSNIFSLSCYVKTIAIAYEPKTVGIMEMLGLGRYTILMQELTAGLLKHKFQKLKEDGEYVKTLSSRLIILDKLTRLDMKSYVF